MILKIYDRFKVRTVEFFSDFQLSLAYDSFGSTFSFSFYFDPKNPGHKELACLTHYHECTVEHNDEVLVQGFAIGQGFTRSSEKKLATISGYSKPGTFEDVNIPPECYPLQSNGLTLLQIAQKITRPWDKTTKYKIDIIVDPAVSELVNKALKASTASETDTVASYLKTLAQQKKVIISHDNKGNLLLTKAKTDLEPIFSLDFSQGTIPGTEYNINFNGQGVHSHITVMKQASSGGGNAGQITVKNPYCPVFYRPKTVTQSSGDDIDTKEVALRELAAEWENLTMTVQTDRWEVDGKIIKPNNTIEIIDPEVYLYNVSEWFIRSIDFVGDAEKTTATLNCVIPEVVNNEMVKKSLFDGINMHP